jgi:hypothetical protein
MQLRHDAFDNVLQTCPAKTLTHRNRRSAASGLPLVDGSGSSTSG